MLRLDLIPTPHPVHVQYQTKGARFIRRAVGMEGWDHVEVRSVPETETGGGCEYPNLDREGCSGEA